VVYSHSVYMATIAALEMRMISVKGVIAYDRDGGSVFTDNDEENANVIWLN